MIRGRLAPGHRLLIVFALTIFTPGLLLAFFGARSIWLERQRFDQQLRTRLNYSADVAARSLSEQLTRLQSRVDHGSFSNGAPLDSPADGSWAFVTRAHGGIQLFPPAVLPFELRDTDRTALTPDLLAAFEHAKQDPSAAQSFYDQLVSGRWRIDKARYLYYSSAVFERVTASPHEETALRLADAVERVVAGARVVPMTRGTYVAFRADAPFRALVVSDRFLASQVPPAADAELIVSEITAGGREVLDRSAPGGSAHRATRSLNVAGVAWELSVEPKDAAALLAASAQTTNVYLGMLSLVVTLLAAGGVVIVRTVRREMEVARLKSDFVATVSHEFRSPLTGIRQLAEMLSRDRVPNEQKRHQYYDLILRESERLGRLVESLLDFARMEDGRRRYRFERVETAAWLQGVAQEFEREAARAGYALEASIPPDLPELSGDRDALSLAVRNLLDNAMKYSPDSKTVWLDAQTSGSRLRIQVRDRGIGIPARQQAQVFEKFYRIDGSTSTTATGVGLGLSLVRHVVESHNGTITVESREGVGSTFAIELACAA